MEANELRKGNLILLSNEIKIVNPTVIVHIDICIKKNRDHSCKPIVLNEEWLLKFGFEKRSNYGNLYDLENYNELTKDCLNRGQGFICLADFILEHGWYLDLQSRTTLNYVHQLQNLYFALTGKELEINQKTT